MTAEPVPPWGCSAAVSVIGGGPLTDAFGKPWETVGLQSYGN